LIVEDYSKYMISYDHDDEVCFDLGKFRAKQKKNKYGQLIGKVYLYHKGPSGSYYTTSSFASFSAMWLLDRFIKEVRS
jgi:hypothetical protein